MAFTPVYGNAAVSLIEYLMSAVEKYGILVCLSDEHEYEVLLNGERFDFSLRGSGVIELTLDGAVQSGNIKINAIH